MSDAGVASLGVAIVLKRGGITKAPVRLPQWGIPRGWPCFGYTPAHTLAFPLLVALELASHVLSLLSPSVWRLHFATVSGLHVLRTRLYRRGHRCRFFFKWEALRTKVAPLLTATLASLSLPDFAWFLPLEGSPWCLSRAGLRLLLSLLNK